MAAQLGETQDPKELIPGDAPGLHEQADHLTTWSTVLEGVGDDLKAVRVDGWSGAASEGFWEGFAPEAGKWFRGADSLNATAEALRAYAGTVAWAQAKAVDAIVQHKVGDQLGAVVTLQSAREQLDEAGKTAAKRFKAQGGADPGAPAWLYWAAQDANTSPWALGAQVRRLEYENLLKYPQGENQEQEREVRKYKGWGANDDRVDTEDRREKGAYGVRVEGVSASGEAKAWEAAAEGRGAVLGGDVAGRVSISALGAEGSAGAGMEDGRLQAQVSGKAYLGQATAEGKYEAGLLEASGKAQVFVGGDASAKASVGTDGAHLGGEAFAGAKASAEGHAAVAGVGVGGTAEGWAGAGVSAHVDAGMEDGKVVIGADVGAGLGLGGKLGGQVEVDPVKVVDAVGDGVDAVKDWGGGVTDTVESWF
ncbi:putative T7SS-secreted protein [Streptomyces sp. NPDC002795]|uniref:putative T7SS-secreted protein n=1 Tax=Streptomyces sp. NPDC002795 TaxID=3364665 RepID=UPI0036B4B63C